MGTENLRFARHWPPERRADPRIFFLRPVLPPRAKIPQAPAPAKKPTGKKPGGQPGHPPVMKTLVPPERVSEVIDHIPERCSNCAVKLPKAAGPDDPEPTRFQVAELPPLVAVITEHRGHARTCSCCGEVTRASIPADVCEHSVGPRLTALMQQGRSVIDFLSDTITAHPRPNHYPRLLPDG
jgi:hypothetical protein